MMSFTFNATDKGLYGDPCEMLWKYIAGIKDWDTVSPPDKPDFRYNHHCYDVKQNGSVLKYSPNQRGYVKGSSRVIYATHIEHTLVDNGDGTVTITIDMAGTQWYILDKREFIDFLKSINALKVNSKRQQVNVQTCYNYTKDAYHGAKGRKIEEWAYEHELDDDLMDRLMETFG